MNITRQEIYDAILARLEEKSEHAYQWPRWAAAEEASMAVIQLLIGKDMIDIVTGPVSQPPPRSRDDESFAADKFRKR